MRRRGDEGDELEGLEAQPREGCPFVNVPKRFEERAHRRVGHVDCAPAFAREAACEFAEVDGALGKDASERFGSGRPVDSECEARVQRRGKRHDVLADALIVEGELAVVEANRPPVRGLEFEPSAQAPIDLQLTGFDVAPFGGSPGHAVEQEGHAVEQFERIDDAHGSVVHVQVVTGGYAVRVDSAKFVGVSLGEYIEHGHARILSVCEGEEGGRLGKRSFASACWAVCSCARNKTARRLTVSSPS